MKTKDLINKRVRIICPVYKNGKTFYGLVRSIKTTYNKSITYNVLIDGNNKTTSFAERWLLKLS